jgi:hypothetical protein
MSEDEKRVSAGMVDDQETEPKGTFVSRRVFLRKTGLAAGGVLLPYVAPTVATASIVYDCDLVQGAAEAMGAFTFTSDSQQALLEAVVPVGLKYQTTGAQSLTDQEVEQVWWSGWAPVVEMNRDAVLREAVNTALGFQCGIWTPGSGDTIFVDGFEGGDTTEWGRTYALDPPQWNYLMPAPSVVRSELQNLSGICPNIAVFSAIAIGIIVGILILDCPQPAY